MDGLRHNINGFEVGVDPKFSFARFARGYYDSLGHWQLEKHWQEKYGDGSVPIPFPTEERLDSRGNIKFTTGVAIAIGKTFRSGKLNIPVNVFIIPSPGGTRFGISFGCNSKG